jgi:hypothetical protein
MKKQCLYGLIGLLSLGLVGCGSYSPKAIVKKGGYYVRDRENDFHTSCLAPPLMIPEGLSELDISKAQIYPQDVPMGKPCVNIEPPGVPLR